MAKLLKLIPALFWPGSGDAISDIRLLKAAYYISGLGCAPFGDFYFALGAL
jgi:hypothetical protein